MSNILFCITGPSGSGKTTVMKDVMNNEVGSITSRAMREGEVQGREYLFVSKEEFLDLIGLDELAEFTEYAGNYYGTTKEELQTRLDEGHAYVICDNHGFQQFADVYDNVISIFLYADPEECGANMEGRGDNLDVINKRLSTYFNEVGNKGQYDYVVKNVRGYKQATEHILRQIINVEILKNMDREAVK